VKPRTLALCATSIACATLPLPADAGLRYECRALDGSTHRFEDNPLPRWSALLAECRAVQVSAHEADTAAAPPAGGPDVVVIVRRNAPEAALARLAGGADVSLPTLPEQLARIVEAAAQRHEIDARIVQAVIQVESSYNPQARSPKGALGLMQLMPATAVRLGAAPAANLFDPALNIELGVRYLRLLGNLFNGRLDLVLAAYNAGEGAVMRHGMRVPPYPETQAYVRKISALLMVETP
jgi:soluble lytic murein transglycosylase-like protein